MIPHFSTKTKKKKRKVKTPLQKLHDKCWEMAKKVVKLRDHGQCQRCFKPVKGTNAHTSHTFPKSTHAAIKYNLLNLTLLCYHDHINWWHKNPVASGAWIRERYPERMAVIEKIPRCRSYRMDDLQEILEELQNEYWRLQNG